MCFERSYTRNTPASAKVSTPVSIPVAETKFNVGDKVRVKQSRGGPLAGLPATVTDVSPDGVTIKIDAGRIAFFLAKNLELIAAVEPATKYAFKVGDRVTIDYDYNKSNPYWDGPGTVYE